MNEQIDRKPAILAIAVGLALTLGPVAVLANGGEVSESVLGAFLVAHFDRATMLIGCF